MQQDKIIEVKLGQVRQKGQTKEVWQRMPFDLLKPDMIFRVVNDPAYDGKMYKCTSLPIYPKDGGNAFVHCDELKEFLRPEAKYTL